MAIERIIPEAVPGPRSDYSLVSVVDAGRSIAYIAGQTGRREDGSIDPGPDSQASTAFEKLRNLLLAVDSGPLDIIHMTTYVVGREAMAGFVAARRAVFEGWFPGVNPPSSTLAIVAGLADPDALIEIEVVAAVSDRTLDNPDPRK